MSPTIAGKFEKFEHNTVYVRTPRNTIIQHFFMPRDTIMMYVPGLLSKEVI